MEFVAGPKIGDCVFCAMLVASDDRESLIVHRGRSAFVALNLYPYAPGHLLVVPCRHVADPWSLEPSERHEVDDLVTVSMQVLREELRPEGFNLGANVGRVAGAGIAHHVHHHVVPRWTGDTNFMPVIGAVSVMPEHLRRTYERLRPRFDRLADRH
ncbi:MAG: HIT domain-containing protein [Deltaproteobacteria bacterium]|nr:HIT domain-containing protein [Deltaproteobacteria bacterium]